MTKVWLAAGFRTAQVDTKARKVVFCKVDAGSSETPPHTKKSGRHPLFGALKGLIRVAPDVDLTEPAEPDWCKVYE